MYIYVRIYTHTYVYHNLQHNNRKTLSVTICYTIDNAKSCNKKCLLFAVYTLKCLFKSIMGNINNKKRKCVE